MKFSCTFIGHATALIEIGGTTILTDPHFGKRTIIMPRRTPLPISPADVPDLACVLVSHLHYDHLNISSYKYISCGVPIIVPEACEPTIGQYLSNPVVELSHFANHELADGTEITAVPVMHRGGRLSQLRFTGSNGYLIRHPEMEGAVLFCADSAYGPHFGQTGKLGRIDLALLPIGGYEPRWFMRSRHMTPAEAVQAFEDLKARHMIPIHYGTFRLSAERLSTPISWLEKILTDRPDLAGRIHILKPGERFNIS